MFERVKDLKLSIIKQIEIAASKYPDSISLAQGIANFDTPEAVKRRAENALKRGVVAKYSLSPGLPELRELIEISLAKENMFYDWQKEIIITAGSIEGISATILAISNPGDEILIPEPTYTSYREVITLAGCKPVFVPLDENKGWSFSPELYEKAITPKTKAIFYCNPNNPTGTIYSQKQLLALAELAEKYDLFLISDDVYKDFVYDETKIFSLAEIPKYRKRVIRLFSFSKAFCMTGWRVGYVHSDESVIKEIIKVHDCLVTCAPVISQYAAMGALETAQADIIAFNEEYKQRLELVCARLDKLKDFFSYIKPSSSYYIFPKILKGERDSLKFAYNLLEKTHVAVVPGFAFGPSGEGHFRINFGRSRENISEAFDRIEKFLGF